MKKTIKLSEKHLSLMHSENFNERFPDYMEMFEKQCKPYKVKGLDNIFYSVESLRQIIPVQEMRQMQSEYVTYLINVSHLV